MLYEVITALVEQVGAVAEVHHARRRMRDEQDRRAGVADFLDARETLALERP